MPEIEYVWDELSDNVIEEYEDGVLSVSYTHEPGLYGNLLSQNRNGVTSYYHYDGRGDTVALTDDSGNVSDTMEYDAWGNVIASTGSTVTPYQSVGRNGYQAEAMPGFVYIRSRHLDRRLGRWVVRDPRGYLDGINIYAYVKNNVMMRVDPSGMIVGALLQTPKGERCVQCLIFDCHECAQYVSPTAYGCHCGAAGFNVPDGRPIDMIDMACRDHDDCWGAIQPPCQAPRVTYAFPRAISVPDRRSECRMCDATFCTQLEAGDCTEYDSGTTERETCLAYRCYALWLFGCRDFKLPVIDETISSKIGPDWPFGIGGEETCIPLVGRWPPAGRPQPNVKAKHHE